MRVGHNKKPESRLRPEERKNSVIEETKKLEKILLSVVLRQCNTIVELSPSDVSTIYYLIL
jgi:hypothetical protein